MSFMTANQDRCNKNQVFPCSCVSCKIDKEKAKKRKEKNGMWNNNTPNCVFICKGHFPKMNASRLKGYPAGFLSIVKRLTGLKTKQNIIALIFETLFSLVLLSFSIFIYDSSI